MPLVGVHNSLPVSSKLLNDSSSVYDVAVDVSLFVTEEEEVDEESKVPVVSVGNGSSSKLRSS